MGIDLHAHTTASDGSFSPAALVQHARAAGLRAVGVTDHDTIAGWDEARRSGAATGVEVVPGVELSVGYEGGRFHLLAYYIAPEGPLIERLHDIQAARVTRNSEILGKLAALGVHLTESEVRRHAGGEASQTGGEASQTGGVASQIGRPHFAMAMIERGYVGSMQEAFDRYLGEGQAGFATKAVLTPRDAIAAIHEAGGVAVWAHPRRSRRLSPAELEARLIEWVAWGLDGLETWYSQYTPEDAAWAEAMRRRYNLLGTGGSDFHGLSKPTVQLGVTHTGGPVDDIVLEQLKARRDSIRSVLHGQSK